MQIKGKIFTIAGIVLIFGYFISESFKDPSDPAQLKEKNYCKLKVRMIMS